MIIANDGVNWQWWTGKMRSGGAQKSHNNQTIIGDPAAPRHEFHGCCWIFGGSWGLSRFPITNGAPASHGGHQLDLPPQIWTAGSQLSPFPWNGGAPGAAGAALAAVTSELNADDRSELNTKGFAQGRMKFSKYGGNLFMIGIWFRMVHRMGVFQNRVTLC